MSNSGVSMWRVTVCALLWTLLGKAEDTFYCLREMTMPEFHNTVRSVVPITVTADVKIGPKGQAESLRLTPPNELLENELRRYLVDDSRYSEKCVGKSFTLIFTYRVEGKPSKYPVSITRFQPPNHIIVTSEPLVPIIELDRRAK